MMDLLSSDFLQYTFLGSTVSSWLTLLLLWALLTSVFMLVRNVAIWRLEKIAARTKNIIDDVLTSILQKTHFYFILGLALYLAVSFAPVTSTLALYISRVAFVLLLLQVISWGNHLIGDWVRRYRVRKLDTDAAAVTTMQAVGVVARLVLYSIILLVALDNFGIDVTALIAGLGIGGIAIALALQNILSDLFASLSIVLDKPFVVGDFLILNEHLGTVEQIGLKSTRIRSLSGEQIIISNSDLLNSRIRNYKRMFERRIVFSFGVLYQTPLDKLKQIPEILREIVQSLDDTRFDRAHFKEFGDSSLNFEVVYFVLVPDFNVYMDRQQAINLALFERFEAIGVDFAYPTRTIYVAGSNEAIDIGNGSHQAAIEGVGAAASADSDSPPSSQSRKDSS